MNPNITVILTYVLVMAVCSLPVFGLHIRSLRDREYPTIPEERHQHFYDVLSPYKRRKSTLSHKEGWKDATVTHSTAFLSRNSLYDKTLNNKRIRAVSQAVPTENPQDAIERLASSRYRNIASIRESIKRFRKELNSAKDHLECTTKLALMGAELFHGACEPSILSQPPATLNGYQSFYLKEEGGSSDKRGYFIFPDVAGAPYKQIRGCISSIYISVHVDSSGHVHVDGTSDSLITKAMVALILDSVEGVTSDELMGMDDVDISQNDLIRTIGIIRRNGTQLILNHIKEELKKQQIGVLGCTKPRDKVTTSQKRVAVLLSGGVDSSVALWLLKSRGFDVEAFFLKVWGITQPDDLGNCGWETDMEHVMQICKHLNVPLHVLPFQELYREMVIEPFVSGTRCGETPNPDIFCNEFIKFGAFLDYTKRWGFSHVASGHYARVEDDIAKVLRTSKDGKETYEDKRITRLCISKDSRKDQTYFLCRLDQDTLQRVIFPIGDFLKKEVRQIARVLRFPNSDRKDSMGLCFLGKVNVRSFLASCVGRQPGAIIDDDTQEKIGEHSGLYNFTIGQREGIAPFLTSPSESHKCRHVVRKDTSTNSLYVSTSYGSEKYVTREGLRRRFNVVNIKWNVPDYYRYKQHSDEQLKLKLRHSCNYTLGDIKFTNNDASAEVCLNEPDVGIASGQYAVFYHGHNCVGSGKMMAITP